MRTFCIVLPETPGLTAKARQHFEEAGIEGVSFFDGIHAEKAGLSTVNVCEIDHPGNGWRMGFKGTGTVLSHLMLWAVLSYLPGEHFMVLESDAKFCADWKKRLFLALRDVPPDFDLLYHGSCCCQDQPKTNVKGEVWEVKYPLCTHAYIVAGKALPVLRSELRKIYAPIDIAMKLHALPKLKVYTILPRIVDQFDTTIIP